MNNLMSLKNLNQKRLAKPMRIFVCMVWRARIAAVLRIII